MPTYRVHDVSYGESTRSWDRVLELVWSWYEFLEDEYPGRDISIVPRELNAKMDTLDEGDVDGLNRIITEWEYEIAQACSYQQMCEMGLSLSVDVENEDEDEDYD